MPETTPEILSYLLPHGEGNRPEAGCPDCGALGAETLAVMEREPQRLAEVSGITPPKAREIGRGFPPADGNAQAH